MTSLSLDPGDAAELAEMLQFLSDWLASDHPALGASLTRYTGTRAYNASTLRNDLDRFTFLLGGSDGEALFHPRQQQTRPEPGARIHADQWGQIT